MDDDNYRFYKRKNLLDDNIINGDADLDRMIKFEGFPPGEKTRPGMRSTRLWRRSEVHAWLDARRERMKAFEEERRKEVEKLHAAGRRRQIAAE
ncbi:hypothetical protein GOD94_17150 [Sinorhizobium medicae]|nr:hypothetical protein [Sinorhizobium medicae]MDX0874628.1 hypothetical protein [Sinorhizobium medicae]